MLSPYPQTDEQNYFEINLQKLLFDYKSEALKGQEGCAWQASEARSQTFKFGLRIWQMYKVLFEKNCL